MSKTNGRPSCRPHYNAVLRASSARLSARIVLQAMIHQAEFDRPEVTITKNQLAEATRLCMNSVRASLRVLRDEGTIVPIRNAAGGRGYATTFRLCIAGQGAAVPAEPAQAKAEASGMWAEIVARMDEAAAAAWLHKLAFLGLEGGVLRLEAPSRFTAATCKRDFGERLAQIAQGLGHPVRRVEIEAAA